VRPAAVAYQESDVLVCEDLLVNGLEIESEALVLSFHSRFIRTADTEIYGRTPTTATIVCEVPSHHVRWRGEGLPSTDDGRRGNSSDCDLLERQCCLLS
jgi:hypothetical protein